MAQKITNLIVQPVPVNTSSTSVFTLASFDLASLPDGTGNFTDCTVFVRATILLFEVGGGTYSSTWEKLATFRRDTSGNATIKGTVVDGNAGSGGQVGSGDLSTITIDGSTTNIRLRVTPSGSGSLWWYGKLQVTAVQGA